MPLVRNPAWNTTSQRAGQVLVESMVCGSALGAGSMAAAVLIMGARDSDRVVALYYGYVAIAYAGAFGLIVGLLAGTLGWLFVRTGEARLGARVVARVLPVIGMAVTLPIALVIALPGNARWRAFVFTIAVVLTLAGSYVVAYRYLRRAEWPPVH